MAFKIIDKETGYETEQENLKDAKNSLDTKVSIYPKKGYELRGSKGQILKDVNPEQYPKRAKFDRSSTKNIERDFARNAAQPITEENRYSNNDNWDELERRQRAMDRRDRHNTLKNLYDLEDKEYNPLTEALKDSGRQPILEDDNGDYWYVEYKNGKLVAGHATNSGIVPEFEIDYDHDSSLDGNLERLWDKIHK